MKNQLITTPSYNPETIKMLFGVHIVLDNNEEILLQNPYQEIDPNKYVVRELGDSKLRTLKRKYHTEIFKYVVCKDKNILYEILTGYNIIPKFAKLNECVVSLSDGKLISQKELKKLKRKYGKRVIKLDKKLKEYKYDVIRRKPAKTLKQSLLYYSKLNIINHLISECEKTSNLKVTSDMIKLKIQYIELEDTIVSYVEQTQDRNYKITDEDHKIHIEFLKSIFSNIGNCKSYDEYINKRIKFLFDIDADDYIKHLNNEYKVKKGLK